MIDELELIKQMLGDLTGVGIWGFVSYLGYGLARFLVGWGAVFYILNRLITMGFDYIKCPVKKSDYDDLFNKHEKLIADTMIIKADHSSKETKLNSEVERIKHLYKILKESSDHKAAKDE